MWEQGASFPYVLTLQEIDEPVGMLEIHNKGFKVEIGYALARPHWDKGHMTEALRTMTMIEWVFAQPDIFRAQSFCDVENFGSARVMEKSGMTCEGLLRRYTVHPNISDEPRDVYLYEIVI